jgi:glutamate-1-semialdehyde 2,1-aminomutase
MDGNNNVMWVGRFRNAIPWGSSTCSKAPRLLPDEPAVIVRGKGCRVWDADVKEYIDYRNGLGPVTLGYSFPEVDKAVKEQLDKGIVFGHPSPIECEVAEMLKDIVPCAEKVRFLKTGGEAAAACIRIACYHTGREHIIQIGYNGWLNALATGGSNLPRQESRKVPNGVPGCLSSLYHYCGWNDTGRVNELFSEYKDRIAAVVVAADYENMRQGETFYPFLREITSKNGALLILDEIVTGFRVAIGGVHEYFGFMPDMCVFAKGIANGMPLSAYMGRKEIMDKLEPGGVTVSSTYGGEALSLAAAKATINTYLGEDVIGHIWKQGGTLWSGVNELFEKYDIPLEFRGLWPCPILTVKSDVNREMKNGGIREVKDEFFRQAYRNSVSLYDVSYVNYSHGDNDINETLERLDTACKSMKSA